VIEIVEIGKQLLITAMFVALCSQLDSINIMRLATPQSAILLAVVIFKALIIIATQPCSRRPVGMTT
jgi:potassium-transporting ATPase ATP-binding subunit